jgi:hypothetical protein
MLRPPTVELGSADSERASRTSMRVAGPSPSTIAIRSATSRLGQIAGEELAPQFVATSTENPRRAHPSIWFGASIRWR